MTQNHDNDNSDEEMEDQVEIVKFLEDLGTLLLKGVNQTIKNEAKGQKGKLFGMLSVTLGTSLL